MSKLSDRLNDYQTQMSIYAEQHKIILANDVLDMIEQLQEDLEDDIEKVVAELEEEKEISCAYFTKYVNEYNPCLDDEYDDFFHKGLERAIAIIGKGGVE